MKGAVTDLRYGLVPLQNLADITSGVTKQNSTYNPDLFNNIYTRTEPEAVLNWFKIFKKAAEPDEVFNNYNPNYYMLSLSFT